jgi:succinate dehydrogenase / fumarate reductase cytochrome b subunit
MCKGINVNHTRPKNLNLFTIHFPLPAIVSILHRVSGVFLFLLIPLLLGALACSLQETGFAAQQAWANTLWAKLIFWVILMPFCYHLVAGIRHLLMDLQVGTRLKTARLTSVLTFVVTFVLIILTGIWLW